MMSFSQTPLPVSLTVKNRRFFNLPTHTPASYITISVEVEGIQGPRRISPGLNLFSVWLPGSPPPFSISWSIEALPPTSLTYTYFYVSHQEQTQDKILSTECANLFSHLKVKFYRGQDPNASQIFQALLLLSQLFCQPEHWWRRFFCSLSWRFSKAKSF